MGDGVKRVIEREMPDHEEAPAEGLRPCPASGPWRWTWTACSRTADSCWGPGRRGVQAFSLRDVMGISMGRKAGLIFALISGEGGPLVRPIRRPRSGIPTSTGLQGQGRRLRTFSDAIGVPLAEICFMGDDVNDLPAMRSPGLPRRPAGTPTTALQAAAFVTKRRGGHGAVRELLDRLLARQAEKAAP